MGEGVFRFVFYAHRIAKREGVIALPAVFFLQLWRNFSSENFVGVREFSHKLHLVIRKWKVACMVLIPSTRIPNQQELDTKAFKFQISSGGAARLQ